MPVIPGLSLDAVAVAARADGLSCVSTAGISPDTRAGYTLGCEGQDQSAHASISLSVTYWTLDAISEMVLSVTSNQPGAVVSSTAPRRLLGNFSYLSGGENAQAWVHDHVDDPACRPDCTQAFGALRITLYVGANGAREVDIWEAAG